MDQRKLSPLTLWALAFGCCRGWGSFIMPGVTVEAMYAPEIRARESASRITVAK